MSKAIADPPLLPMTRAEYRAWAEQQPQVLHHRRDDAGQIQTQIITAGRISLDPPGITIAVDEIYT